jgi:DNA polymerase-3 subunit delta'
LASPRQNAVCYVPSVVTLDQIRGQDRAVAQLRRALETDRVAHAYLFAGPAGSGKHTTGLALALALNCTVKIGQGCGSCASCEKIAAGLHPDVQTLERSGAAKIIPIETIRRQVIPRLASPPHEGRARVFLIEEATSLAGPSANALLKTLEEPPPRTHFVIGTTAPDQVLPTIRSRCQRINFAALPADLRADLADDPATADRLTALADTLATAADGGLGAWLDAAAEAGADRHDAAAVLGILAARYHREAREAALSNDPTRASGLSRRAARVLETETAVTLHNAHAQLALEHLLGRLRAVRIG